MPESGKSGEAELDLLLHALDHPVRRRILRALVAQNSSAKILAEQFGAKAPDISYHLNQVLARECDVVRLVDTVQRRGGVEKVYTIREKRLWVPSLWRNLPSRIGDGVRQLSLRELLVQILAAVDNGNPSVLTWEAAEVDESGWLEIIAAADRFHRTVDAAIRRTRDQTAGDRGGPGVKVIAGVAAFQPASASKVDRWAQDLGELA